MKKKSEENEQNENFLQKAQDPNKYYLDQPHFLIPQPADEIPENGHPTSRKAEKIQNSFTYKDESIENDEISHIRKRSQKKKTKANSGGIRY